MKLRNKIVVGLGLIVLLTFSVFSPSFIQAEDHTDEFNDIQNKIADLEGKISQTRKKKATLASQINYMNQRIQLAALRISQTNTEIDRLKKEIEGLSVTIAKLDISLDKISRLLLNRIVAVYKQGHQIDSPLHLLMGDETSQFFKNQKYLQQAQKHDKLLIVAVEQVKQNFDKQKELKEVKQEKLESLKVQLERRNILLANERQAKENLLEVTRGDEKRYQSLLAQAQQELRSLLAFTKKRVGEGGSYCAKEFSSGETGYFYSQRDTRWCNNLIGFSNMSIGQVGCTINSVAMVYKSKGVDVTPATIAANPSYFRLSTAYMDIWPSFSGFHIISISTDDVDSQLQQNNPVIVHMRTETYDGHWLVLVKKDGDDYIINDPWEGPDKRFSEYYSWFRVIGLFCLRK